MVRIRADRARSELELCAIVLVTADQATGRGVDRRRRGPSVDGPANGLDVQNEMLTVPAPAPSAARADAARTLERERAEIVVEAVESSLARRTRTTATRERWTEEANAHLSYLVCALALALEEDELFARDVAWAAPSGARDGLRAAELRALLEALGVAIARRLPASEAHHAVRMVSRVAAATRLEPPALPEIEAAQAEFLTALLAGDRARAHALGRRAFDRGIEHLYDGLIAPSLRRVGELWYEGRISIADEHLATALAEAVVASLYPSYRWSTGGPHAIVACPEGERHQFGARMLADLLALDGWDALFLGGDVPRGPFVDLAKRVDAKLVAISVTIPRQLVAARETIAAIRGSGQRCQIVVGGRAVAALSDPAAALEADACFTSAGAAVAAVRALRS